MIDRLKEESAKSREAFNSSPKGIEFSKSRQLCSQERK